MRQSDLFKRPKRSCNAGRLIGPKAPLKPEHIWAVRKQLKVAKRGRDLAMFNCALDAKGAVSLTLTRLYRYAESSCRAGTYGETELQAAPV